MEVTETGKESISQIQAHAAQEQDMLAATYHQLRDHKFGKRILDDLQAQFPTDQNVFSATEKYDTHAAAFRDGCRTPVLYILKQLAAYDRRKHPAPPKTQN